MSNFLKDYLKKMFHGADPLDYIQDVRVDATPEGQECVVRVKVPDLTRSFYDARLLYNCEPIQVAVRRMMDESVAAAVMGKFCSRGMQKAPEKEPPKPIKPEEKKLDPVNALKPDRIIYSGPKTIVFWPDGTKTMVSRMEGQEHDEYGAYCAAVVKKMFGATHKAKKFLESVKVVQEPKVKKSEEAPWEQMEMMPMPGTEDPDWGKKHWCPEKATEEEEGCNG